MLLNLLKYFYFRKIWILPNSLYVKAVDSICKSAHNRKLLHPYPGYESRIIFHKHHQVISKWDVVRNKNRSLFIFTGFPIWTKVFTVIKVNFLEFNFVMTWDEHSYITRDPNHPIHYPEPKSFQLSFVFYTRCCRKNDYCANEPIPPPDEEARPKCAIPRHAPNNMQLMNIFANEWIPFAIYRTLVLEVVC